MDLESRDFVKTYPLLGELSRALVLAVAEQLDDAALVWCEAGNFSDDVADECSALAQVSLHARDTRSRLARGDFLYGNSNQHVFF